MSEGLHGFPDCPFYQYHFVGGPEDGTISTGFHPYFRIVMGDGSIYETLKNESQDDYVEWLDDGTRKIELCFQGYTTPPEHKALNITKKEIKEPHKPRKFYEPHPGLLGCPIPIPEEVRIAANELANLPSGTLAQAVEMIEKSYPNGIVTANEKLGIIILYIEEARSTHSWRVIRFKDIE